MVFFPECQLCLYSLIMPSSEFNTFIFMLYSDPLYAVHGRERCVHSTFHNASIYDETSFQVLHIEAKYC